MGIKLNLTADEIKGAQGDFTPLAEGTYAAVIYDAKYGKSKQDNPMYTLTFKITDGPEGINRTIKSYFALTPKALFKVVELNKAVGFPYPKKDTPAGEFEFNDADDYLGIDVNIKIVQEPYASVDDDGNDIEAYRNNVSKVLKADPETVTSAEDVEAGATDKGGLFL